MPKTINLSASSIRTFMSCRRRYWFQYVERLQPLVRETPLSFGSAVHAGLEFLFNSRSNNPERIMAAIKESYSAQELEESGNNPDLALRAVLAYDRNVPWNTWRMLAVEPWFEVSVGHGRRLRGRWDGLVEVNGSLFVLEHKTVAGGVSERALHHLLWDMQAGLYILAAREKGLNVQGILYDFIPKPTIEPLLATPAEKRKYTKEGKLYGNQRDTDETKEAYMDRVDEWYDANKAGFIQHIVQRNQNQIDALVGQIMQLATDIRVCENNEAYYMNPSACAVLSCPYQGVCLEDTPEAREANFTTREK